MDYKAWNHYLEELASPDSIDTSSLKQKKELDPEIWAGDKLNPDILDRLYLIAKEFFQSLKLDSNVTMKDIILTGSLASYNWSSFSDIDLHILIDFKEFDNSSLVRDYFRQKTSNWNRTHKILIKGYEVEVYVQDSSEPHHALGIYSITSDRFIQKPSVYRDKIDYEKIKQKAYDLMEKIDDIYDMYAERDYKEAKDSAEHLIEKIRRYRKAGLEEGGVYSVENMVFKVLRRNDYLKKLIDLKIKSYDKSMSMNGQSLYENETLMAEAVGRRHPLSGVTPAPGRVIKVDAGLLKRRRRKPPKLLVIHHTGTSSPKKTLNVWPPRGSRRASTHYEIDKDGTIYQYLDPGNWVAFHAGCKRRTCKGVNGPSIGIDLTGNFKHMPSLNNPQIRALKALANTLSRRFGIPLRVYTGRKKITAKTAIANGYGITMHRTHAATGCPGALRHLLPTLFGTSSDEVVNIEDAPWGAPPTSRGRHQPMRKGRRDDERTYAAGGRASLSLKRGGRTGSGRFLQQYKRLQKDGLTIDRLYSDLQKTFGPDWSSITLPRHGIDRIFGPEHYGAMKALVSKTKDQNIKDYYKQFISSRGKIKKDPIFAKAEKETERKIKTKSKKQTGSAMARAVAHSKEMSG